GSWICCTSLKCGHIAFRTPSHVADKRHESISAISAIQRKIGILAMAVLMSLPSAPFVVTIFAGSPLGQTMKRTFCTPAFIPCPSRGTSVLTRSAAILESPFVRSGPHDIARGFGDGWKCTRFVLIRKAFRCGIFDAKDVNMKTRRGSNG